MSRIGGKDYTGLRPPSQDELQEAQEHGGEGAGSQGVGLGQPQPKKVNAIDAERMASQAGFVRSGAKKKGQGFDIGDASQAPIPLPEDDVDASEWSLEGLNAAQAQLLRHNARIGRGRGRKRGDGALDLFRALVEACDDDAGEGEEGGDHEAQARHLQALPGEQVPAARAMAAVAGSVQAQFGVDLNGAPVGAALLATSLLIAGHRDDVEVRSPAQGGGLSVDKLAGGLQRVVDEGRNAAEDARRRSEGVNKNLAMHRTFVPKR